MMRYFYQDTLAAAWMAKHHGMSFKYWRWNDLSFQFRPVNRASHEAPTDRLYIHPDSLHLLEPHVSDLYQFTTPAGFLELARVYDAHDLNCTKGKAANSWYHAGITPDRILLRNGIPFMWPESEEA